MPDPTPVTIHIPLPQQAFQNHRLTTAIEAAIRAEMPNATVTISNSSPTRRFA
jgi:hypothetical protein